MVKVLIRLKILESDVGKHLATVTAVRRRIVPALFLRRVQEWYAKVPATTKRYRACHTGDANRFAGRSRCFTDSLFHRLGDGNGKRGK